ALSDALSITHNASESSTSCIKYNEMLQYNVLKDLMLILEASEGDRNKLIDKATIQQDYIAWKKKSEYFKDTSNGLSNRIMSDTLDEGRRAAAEQLKNTKQKISKISEKEKGDLFKA
ncbi:hypothetical protein CANMA_002060, partial [Candida margitis]|uniref:uncharacterized protein n=1 Tax=Candida margitis TaxID=1775924 RepID=UPI002225E3E1